MKPGFRIAVTCFLILTLLGYGVLQVINATFFTQCIIFIIGFFFWVNPFVIYLFRSMLHGTYYFLRNTIKKPDPWNLMQHHIYSGVVLPPDLDILIHMNNARYRRELDFASIAFFANTGLFDYFLMHKVAVTMTSAIGRYRKSLLPFHRYRITTKLVYWDDDKLYFEQRYLSKYHDNDDFVYNINLIALKLIGTNTTEVFQALLSTVPPRPNITKEIELFVEYNNTSSQTLKNELKFD